eukprot:TRINITY_DN3793_c0_g3_i2.p1 TRINITY_DN3793_c0_g3~~TRINITY_DN3793_c0_g3_i2.p1  ORF type:complete len:346 (+),score=68.53 TRINITY_DN3793_c0_g3_i2:666-1703(+)
MTKFCPSMLMPKPLHSKYELPHLVSAMSFCEILLNYHNPDLLNLFKSCEIESEAIIVPWIVTFFIKDIPLELSYLILDRIINRNDKNYIFYMMIGFFLHNQNTIIANREMDDYAEMLPFIRRTLKESIQTRETLLKWLDLADQVEANTPKSFEAHLKFYGFFEKDLLSENDIKGLMSFQIGKIMAIYPFELLEFLARTKNTEMAFKSVTMEREVEEDGINFTIVDFRMEKKDLYLPFTIDIPVTAHTDNSLAEKYITVLKNTSEDQHLCLMISNDAKENPERVLMDKVTRALLDDGRRYVSVLAGGFQGLIKEMDSKKQKINFIHRNKGKNPFEIFWSKIRGMFS